MDSVKKAMHVSVIFGILHVITSIWCICTAVHGRIGLALLVWIIASIAGCAIGITRTKRTLKMIKKEVTQK